MLTLSLALFRSLEVLCTHASQVIICSHYTDVLCELYASTLNQVCNFS